MTLYRVYMIGSDDHIKEAENIECATDQEACVEAERMLDAYPAAEVWEGRRLVARIRAPEQPK
ncbi:MAG TPA: hypothetical protein VH855_29195 [Acetobacteraceae bacterium]|jgi:hypothetical protein